MRYLEYFVQAGWKCDEVGMLVLPCISVIDGHLNVAFFAVRRVLLNTVTDRSAMQPEMHFSSV